MAPQVSSHDRGGKLVRTVFRGAAFLRALQTRKRRPTKRWWPNSFPGWSGASAQSLASIDAQFRREALDAFNEADAAARLRREELTIAEDRNSRAVLTAPVSGLVQQLQVHIVGAVLRAADNLLVIVPDGSTLVVDAMVLNRGEEGEKSIWGIDFPTNGFVREGQSVRVKLEAFPFTRYGVVDGRLTFLSRMKTDHTYS
ncbi:MAG: HlyD family efflux transporter periplasmic adaptor subunit [Caulobacterales bacterium]